MQFPLRIAILINSLLIFPTHGAEKLECKKKLVIDKEGYFYLGKGCELNSVTINHSNVDLDCKSAIIDGQNKEPNGIFINGKGKKIENISIKHCNILNHISFGIWITAGIPMSKWSNDHSLNYTKAPQNIKITQSEISKSTNAGIFIDSYSHDITIENTTIKYSGNVGIYLEQASKNNTIINNSLQNNGWGNIKNLREGLAVDSSSSNKIVNNIFDGNAAGGIFIYKNCGEFYGSPKSAIRWQHSENNLISNNNFRNQKYGIWIASRQTKNLERLQCGDNSVDNKGIYYRDYADNNTVVNNHFCKNIVSIRIESSNNIIENNEIGSSSYKDILIPFDKVKEIQGLTLTGNKILNNTKNTCE